MTVDALIEARSRLDAAIARSTAGLPAHDPGIQAATIAVRDAARQVRAELEAAWADTPGSGPAAGVHAAHLDALAQVERAVDGGQPDEVSAAAAAALAGLSRT